MKKFWERSREPEEEALAQAFCRVRMAQAGQSSGSANRLDYAAAEIIAETLEMYGYALTKIDRPQWVNNQASSSFNQSTQNSVFNDQKPFLKQKDFAE